MKRTWWPALAAAGALLIAAPAGADENPEDVHWSRQFPRPDRSTKMGPNTGMSDGNTKPTITRAKWHDGKLWLAGAWEAGVDPEDTTKSQRNLYWYLWTWSPVHGYEAVCWFHSAQGGVGPDGKLYDFMWLPDGRLLVAGSFTRVGNPGGNIYHRVNGLAVYDADEPTANRWQPFGTFQYNGTVSQGGTIYALAYDPQGNDLYVGGSFAGIPMDVPWSNHIHRYDFDTGSYEPLRPGVGGQKPRVYKIEVDASTTPSTIYVGGKFHYTAGDGQNPAVSDSTARYSTGFASYQEGQGWTTYPADHPRGPEGEGDEGILQRAADFMHFDSVHVKDFLVDGDDIWIVGAFSEGAISGETLRGIAKWDAERQCWTDPTGMGGVGREVWSVAKADDGRIYFAGAFGGRRAADAFFDGFKDGTEGHCAVAYDPASDTWSQLGSGLSSIVMPEVRLCVNGDDVYYVGDFQYIGAEHFGRPNAEKKPFESWYVARWNSTRDFIAEPAETNDAAVPSPAPAPPTRPIASGNAHWSRAFPKPPRARGRQHQMSGATGMSDGMGTPEIAALVWIGDTLYFGGNWTPIMNQRWYVWSYHAEEGWSPIAWEERQDSTGIVSPPEGLAVHDGKLYAYGAIRDPWFGVGIYDPESGEWSRLEGKYSGETVFGNAGYLRGIAGLVNDIAWDSKTGDMYMVGGSGLENPAYEHPRDVAGVIRVDAEGNYYPMGHAFKPENPGKPEKSIHTICLDENQDPTAIYVGGTWGYHGETPTHESRMSFNVARWDHEAEDWAAIGKGNTFGLRGHRKKYYPDGMPGLPVLATHFQGFLRSSFPRVRDLAVDQDGNLYAAGCLAIRESGLPVHERRESFGIAKWDRATDEWVPCTSAGGFSRDVFQMSWVDDTHLLLSGAFSYDEQWRPMGNVGLLDITTGEVTRLGGGLLRETRGEVIGACVVHTIEDGQWWFGGLFDHAGVNAGSPVAGPIESYYVAMYDPDANLDPNRGLEIGAIEPIEGPSGFSSKSARVTLTASLTEGEGTITWYEARSTGYAKKGQGESFNASVRVKPGQRAIVYYVTVTRDGVEGGKRPVRIPVTYE